MKAISTKVISITDDGKNVVEALIESDNTPDALPTTGAGIDGMSENDVFAPFSILYVVANVSTKVYIANESGVFIAQ